MKVVLFGATGMIGAGVLLECLDDARVERVLAVVRKPTGMRHPKLEEIVHHDFYDYSSLQVRWPAFDGCLFCLGVTSVGMAEAPYRRITYDLTLAAAGRAVIVRAVGVRSGEHFADEHWTGMEPATTIHDIGALPRTLHLLEEP